MYIPELLGDSEQTKSVYVTFAGASNNYSFNEQMRWTSSFQETEYFEFTPERCYLHVSGITNITSPLDLQRYRFVAPVNSDKEIDYPMVFAYQDYKSCVGESQMDSIITHKQYCELFVTVHDEYFRGDDVILRVEGRSTGIELFTLAPVEGQFAKSKVVGQEHKVTFILPRQNQNDLLTISLYINGELQASAELTEHISQIGYDWSKEDLDDLKYFFDKLTISSVLEIKPWGLGEEKEIEID